MSVDRWTCGHDSGATCAQCYHDLAEKAAELQAIATAYEAALQQAERTFAKNKSRMHVLHILRWYLNEELGR